MCFDPGKTALQVDLLPTQFLDVGLPQTVYNENAAIALKMRRGLRRAMDCVDNVSSSLSTN